MPPAVTLCALDELEDLLAHPHADRLVLVGPALWRFAQMLEEAGVLYRPLDSVVQAVRIVGVRKIRQPHYPRNSIGQCLGRHWYADYE